MNKNILFYGNCQCNAIKLILNLPSYYKVFIIECFSTTIESDEFTNIIKKSDIIITQPVCDNYRNKDYLSTKYIIDNRKSDCKIILFNPFYFNFYYFDLTYKRLNNNELLKVPIDYHYNDMITCYKLELPIEKYFEYYVDNIYYKNNDDLDKLADESFIELDNRYKSMLDEYVNNNNNIFPIYITDFIKNNYKDRLLFYSMNHPTKFLLQLICDEIIKVLGIETNIDYDIDPLDTPKCILYKCIQNGVHFNIYDYNSLTLNKSGNYIITKLYFESYKDNNINF
jgi:hypothetical protein